MEQKYKSNYKEKIDELISSNPDQKKYQEICCPKCNEGILAEDLNIHDSIAKCGSCNIVFSFADQVEQAFASVKTEIIGKPKGFDVFESPEFSEISLRQPPQLLFILLLSFLPFFIIISMVNYFKHGYAGAYYPMMILISLFLFSIFRLVRRKDQRIFITIDSGKFTREYRPHNLNRALKLDTNQIQQIYVSKTDSSISLKAIVNEEDGQKHIKIISRLENLIHAKYLEQELEKILKIKNKAVPGEQR